MYDITLFLSKFIIKPRNYVETIHLFEKPYIFPNLAVHLFWKLHDSGVYSTLLFIISTGYKSCYIHAVLFSMRSDGGRFSVCVQCASYMEHAASQQLFICYGDGAFGKPFSKQRPTHWRWEGISHASELADLDPLEPSEHTPPSFGGFFCEATAEGTCLK